jgi:hypothetical protein
MVQDDERVAGCGSSLTTIGWCQTLGSCWSRRSRGDWESSVWSAGSCSCGVTGRVRATGQEGDGVDLRDAAGR